MKNSVTATITFSYKGKTYSPSITIELDNYLQARHHLANLYPLIATKNNIDHYSYEYEMMQAERIQFSEPQGLIANFIHNGELDIPGFEAAWKENNILTKLQDIANSELGIDNFEQQPGLKKALLDAYLLGQQETS